VVTPACCPPPRASRAFTARCQTADENSRCPFFDSVSTRLSRFSDQPAACKGLLQQSGADGAPADAASLAPVQTRKCKAPALRAQTGHITSSRCKLQRALASDFIAVHIDARIASSS